MKSLLIRADANASIASGHVMRCLALAQGWQANGGGVSFLGDCESDELRERIKASGAQSVHLARSHPDPADLRTTLSIAEQLTTSGSSKTKPWVVLDGYHLDSSYQEAVRAAGYRTMIIDDVAHLDRYHADILLNQNIDSDQLQYNCNPEAKQLLGPRYALLREEFLAWKNWERKIPEIATRILVTMGGGDPANVTRRIIEALSQIEIEDLEVIVAVGANNPYYDELCSMVSSLDGKRSGSSIRLVRNASNMPELIAWADVAISSSGSTSWELAFMGLPAMVTILADNQKNIARGLANAGVVVNLGWYQDISSTSIRKALTELSEAYDQRRSQSARGRALIDGNGVQRVVSAMAELDQQGQVLTVRRAVIQDSDQLWRLANDRVVRQNSFAPEEISLSSHESWYSGKLESADCSIWILESEGEFAAQVRYDRIQPNIAEIDFAVMPLFRGQGVGTRALTLTRELACRELGVKIVCGTVKESNPGSMRAFLKAGFKEKQTSWVKDHQCALFEWECNGEHIT